MSPRTARLLLVLGAFVAGLVLFSAVILIVTGRSPAPIAMPSAAIGGPFRLVDQNAQADHRAGLEGPAVPGVLRLHPLPGRLPDHAVRNVGNPARARAGRRPRARAVRHRRSRARHAGDAQGLSVELRSAHASALTGDAAAIAAVEKAYRVYAKKVPLDGGDYTMDHTAIVYLMDKDGRFVAPFNIKRRPEEAAADLRRYLLTRRPGARRAHPPSREVRASPCSVFSQR